MNRYVTVLITIIMYGCSCSGTTISGDGDEVSDFPWEPPIGDLGEPGWEDSSDPLCPELIDNAMVFSVWSDHEGVYTAVLDSGYSPEGTYNLTNIFYNNGDDWSQPYESILSEIPAYQRDGCFRQISRINDGKVITWGGSCELATLSETNMEWAGFVPDSVFAVSGTNVYACAAEGLLKYDGSVWHRISTQPCPDSHYQGMWAGDNIVLLPSSYGMINRYFEDAWGAIDTGVFNNIYSIWLFTSDDIWAGTENGILLHYNGVSWTVVEWNSAGISDGINGMWGIGGDLAFYTNAYLAIYKDSVFKIIEMPEGVIVNDIWGNTIDEIFIAISITDEWLHDPDCGNVVLLYWDGYSLHWM